MENLLFLILNVAFSANCSLKQESTLSIFEKNTSSISQVVNGKRIAYHDGPNCYNAALFGKGYIKELTYTDTTEFSYYVNKFCRLGQPPEKPGDIITLKFSTEAYEHAALSIEGDLIFEKDSTWGKNPPFATTLIPSAESAGEKARVRQERFDSSLYKIKNKKESSYFGNLRSYEQQPYEQIYKCRDSNTISNDLDRLNYLPGIQEILNANKKIENFIFKEKMPEDWQELIADDIQAVANVALKSTSGNDDELYLFTKVNSLVGQLHHLTGFLQSPDDSQSAKFNTAFRSLKAAQKKLETQQRLNKSKLAKKIILSI